MAARKLLPLTLEKYEGRGKVLMNGIQALVRVAVERRRLDVQQGLNTAGFVSGYRGSPLAGMDQELMRNAKTLRKHDINFIPGINEELGAAMVWGTQKLKSDTEYDGVFGMWYAKGPGVDRAADVLRQANATGVSRYGGCLALCGDDLQAKSSMLPNQSEFLLQHFEMPFFNPSDLQDVLEYGLHALELSRHSGAWAGMICTADVVDGSGRVDVDALRLLPKNASVKKTKNDDQLNRELFTHNRIETERVARKVRLPLAMEYVRRRRLNHVALGDATSSLAFVATGKAYRDLLDALSLLGADARRFCVYKVAVPWPLDAESFRDFAASKRRVVVLEHKRAFLEPQVKEALYDDAVEVWGKTRNGSDFLSDVGSLEVHEIARCVAEALEDPHLLTVADSLEARVRVATRDAKTVTTKRRPFFCAGCPHATSTKIPSDDEKAFPGEKAPRAFPGIGCHLMAETTGNVSEGLPAMGVEGAPWVGQAPFASRTHAFVNVGDGTFYHSALLAIRQAVSAGTNVTFKILFNDAVAMTGGQPHDGPLTVDRIVAQVRAEGVARVAVVSDDTTNKTDVFHRDELGRVQRELAATEGTTILVYDQACAAEKRRKRRRGTLPDPPRRLFINEKVCEGCGDCSVQSSCIAVEPLDTDVFGEKRRINQSLCNKDFSCVKGFCPSFVWVDGDDTSAKGASDDLLRAIADRSVLLLDDDDEHRDDKTSLVVAGVGGLGVTTVSAVLSAGAVADDVKAASLDVTGLAQKNGPVTSHLRFGEDAVGSRVPVGTLDTLIACDALVAASDVSVLAALNESSSLVVCNSHVMPTADFVTRGHRDDGSDAKAALRRHARTFVEVDATSIAEQVLGDAIFANVVCLGAAHQLGGVPLSAAAIEQAFILNGASVTANTLAFRCGRLLVAEPSFFVDQHVLKPPTVEKTTLDETVEALAAELVQYQNAAYAGRYRAAVAPFLDFPGKKQKEIAEAVALSLFRAMAYKDEYEVARLYAQDPAFLKAVEAQFKSVRSVSPVFAPPLLSPTDPATGRPKKMTFRGPWVFPALRVLAAFKFLRGTWLDPLAYSVERRHERDLVDLAFDDASFILDALDDAQNFDLLLELARVPGQVRGFGPVKEANRVKALQRRDALRAEITQRRAAVSKKQQRPDYYDAPPPALEEQQRVLNNHPLPQTTWSSRNLILRPHPEDTAQRQQQQTGHASS